MKPHQSHSAPKQLKRSGCKRLSRSISNNSSATWQTSICCKVTWEGWLLPIDPQGAQVLLGDVLRHTFFFWPCIFCSRSLWRIKSHHHSMHHSLQAKRGYNLRMCATGKRLTKGHKGIWTKGTAQSGGAKGVTQLGCKVSWSPKFPLKGSGITMAAGCAICSF